MPDDCMCDSVGFREQISLSFVRQPGRTPGELFAGAVAITPAQRESELDPDPLSRLAGLFERFLRSGPAGIADDEMLELVLSRAVPRCHLRCLVERLISGFGDYNAVISAPAARLSRVEGVGPEVICQLKIVEAAAHRLARARVINRHAMSSWAKLIDYCRTTMAHREIEHLRILFLDRKNVLIADEEQARGTVDHVPVYPREVVKRALELNASAIILVHNHPSGDPTPSAADVEMTRRIQRATKSVGIALHDHLIVGTESDVSFRSQGLL